LVFNNHAETLTVPGHLMQGNGQLRAQATLHLGKASLVRFEERNLQAHNSCAGMLMIITQVGHLYTHVTLFLCRSKTQRIRTGAWK